MKEAIRRGLVHNRKTILLARYGAHTPCYRTRFWREELYSYRGFASLGFGDNGRHFDRLEVPAKYN